MPLSLFLGWSGRVVIVIWIMSECIQVPDPLSRIASKILNTIG